MARPSLRVASALGLACVALPALAAPPAPTRDRPTAALLVTRAPEAERCPDGPGLAHLVARRLGRDPFDPLALRKAEVAFARAGHRFVAIVRVREPSGREGRRRLEDRACEPLGEAVALALAVAVDPLGLDHPAFARPPWAVRAAERDPAASAPRRGPEPTPPVAPAPRPSAGGVHALTWRGAAGVGLELGFAPAVLVGPGARLDARAGPWRGGLELAARFAPPTEVAGATVSTLALGARLDGCRALGAWSVCLGAAARAWSVHADRGLTAPVDAARAVGSVELAVGLAATPGVRLELRLGLALPRPALVLDGREVWRAGPVALGLALSGSAP